MKVSRAIVVITLVAISAASTASAQKSDKTNEAAAQVLFDDALKLMDGGKAAAACPKFEESQRLDPGMGTQFRLAECYEKSDRLVAARSLYLEVAEAAKIAKSAPREQAARKRVDALDAKLVKVTITVAPDVASLAGLEVKLDGQPLAAQSFGVEAIVEAGDHEVSARAPGHTPWSTKLALVAATSQTISVPTLAAEAIEVAPAPPPPAMTSTPTSAPAWPKPRIAAVAVGGLGVVGVVVGAVFGLKAKSNWNDTLTHCENGDAHKCDATGISLKSDASTSATVSTIGFAVGGVALAGAAVLWFTSKPAKSADVVSFTPLVDAHGASAVLRGSF